MDDFFDGEQLPEDEEIPEISDYLRSYAVDDIGAYEEYAADIANEEEFWDAYAQLDDEQEVDLGLAVGGRRWVPNKQARWPKGAPGGLGGQFMKMDDILARVESEPVVDISPLASGARHIGKVQLSQVRVRNKVDGLTVSKTPNPNVLLLSVRMKAGEAAADTAFYVSKKALGIEMIQNLLMKLNAGTQLKQLLSSGIRRLTNKSFYNPYRVISRIIRGQVGGVASFSEGEGGEYIMEFGELFFSEGAVVEEDGLIWKSTLPVGELAMSPDYLGRPTHKPLRVIEGHSDDPKQALGLADLVEAFEAGVIQHVTIPETHADRAKENTGFVKRVKIAVDPNLKVPSLWVGMEVKDEDVKAKMKDGRIANVSAGVAYDHYRKTDGAKFPAVLKHVALTNKPWVPGMLPFGEGNFSEDTEIIPMVALSTTATWDETRSIWKKRDMLCAALEAQPGVELELLDFDGNSALVRNNTTNQVLEIPYTRRNDSTAFHWPMARALDAPELKNDDSDGEPSVEDRADAAREALGITPKDRGGESTDDAKGGETHMSELTDQEREELERLRAERDQLLKTNAETQAQNRVAEVDKRINALGTELGLSEQPGFLRVVRELMLADVAKEAGANGVNLSEDHASADTTVTDAVEKLLAALPRDEQGKLQLSEQQDGNAAGDPPPAKESEELSVEEKAQAARDRLGIPAKGRV